MSEDISILAASRRKHYGTVEPGGATRPKPHKLYHISPGDTLVSIAVKYGTTVQHLKLLNHLWSTDISSLECIKVPTESVASGSNTTTSSECNSQSIELVTVTSKREPRIVANEQKQQQQHASDDDPDTTATSYLQSLFDRAQRAKQSASSVLENSKLSEILTETSPALSMHSSLHRSSLDVEQPMVMVTSPSTASLNSTWIGPSVQRPQTYTTPPNWHDNYQL